MTQTIRKFIESPLRQGADESIAYQLTTTPWGSSPSSVAVVLKTSDGTDVSATNLTGVATTLNDVITTPQVTGLTAGTVYRLEIKFTSGGSVFEAWGDIIGEQ